MPKNLVIVESPAKGKTIEGFLGKDFVVKSSFGHIRDLPEKSLAIDIKRNFQPKYVISPDKKKIIAELKKAVGSSEMVWLATDEDREGEAISWHLKEVLEIPEERYKRIVFHEITKEAIVHSIQHPRKIDMNLVNAQQARRVIDRLVGYEMSPVLWKKVKPALSAGRVQSVAVRLIVERERDILNFKEKSYYRVLAHFITGKGEAFKAELNHRFDTREEAMAFLESCKAYNFTVESIEKKPAKRSPSPPFTTSTLQQEAYRKLGFSVSQTMLIAQKLYEAGKITYMRTDSVNLSELAINTAKTVITEKYGDSYTYPRKYQTRIKSAQEAHEAIRPTYLKEETISASAQEEKLYHLIWKRTIASQMADAEIEKTIITLSSPHVQYKFVSKGEVIRFDGFLKVYSESDDAEADDEENKILPDVKEGESLRYDMIESIEKFLPHPPRYTEASLVKKMEELGIGRPSTYAPTISTIIKRGYVVKEDKPGKPRECCHLILKKDDQIEEKKKIETTGSEKAKLFPTDVGMVVNDFLMEYFPAIMDYGFTAEIEKGFDDIAEGTLQWTDMVKDFYTPFHASIEKTLAEAEKNTAERYLGVDPKTGRKVYVKIGRYGPMIQIGESTEKEKPLFASLPKGKRMDEITLEEAIKCFEYPKILGQYEGKDVIVNIGKFGPYLKVADQYVNLKRLGYSPDDITITKAIELIEQSKDTKNINVIKEFEKEKITVMKGRYGPYIKHGNKNYKIPKEYKEKVSDITLEECLQIIQSSENKGK